MSMSVLDGMTGNGGRLINAAAAVNSRFLVSSVVTQATSREEDEQQCCHSKANA
jgi:hypothetical protein